METVCVIDEVGIKELWKTYIRDRRIEDRNLLIEAYLHLVQFAANRIIEKVPKSVLYEDLVSMGTFGLIQAIEAYDPSRKVPFAVFARQRIRGSILDEVRSNDWLPRVTRDRTSSVVRATRAFVAIRGRKPTESELCKAMKLSKHRAGLVFGDCQKAVILMIEDILESMFTKQQAPSEHVDFLQDKRIRDVAEQTMSRDWFVHLLRGLSHNEKTVVEMRYVQGLTFREIGKALGVGQSRISQIHGDLMRRFRERLESEEDQ